MKRREFLKGSVLITATLASGNTLAYASEKGLLRLKNRDNPTVLEQKHVPAIEAPKKVSANDWFDLNVKIGFMKEHPSVPDHWITMIKLLVDGKEVARTDFKLGGISAPSSTFRIRLAKTSTLEVVENCNKHGTWISDPVKIEVA